jgi:catechol 1,2-dioxygenase
MLPYSSLSKLTTAGLYEQQDPNQTEHNLRGKFITDAEGNYACYCLRPTPYPVSSLGQSAKENLAN